MTTTLERITNETSRMSEFFTEKELTMQIGARKSRWAIYLLKEMIDNSLDACESAGIAPEISVQIKENAFRITDNGPGLPADIVEKSLDYSTRTSTNNGYVSPTRGQLGNALKCLYAAPFVGAGSGLVRIEARGVRHDIAVEMNAVLGQPTLSRKASPSNVKNGTKITISWASVAGYLEGDESRDFYISAFDVICDAAAFNPHATLSLALSDGSSYTFDATNTEWTKWTANQPTSPHWYCADDLSTLIAAYLRSRPAMTVREFIATFNGLSATAKQKTVAEAAGLTSAKLSGLIIRDKDFDMPAIAALLHAMQSESRAIKPAALGPVGADHFRNYMIDVHVSADSVKYKVEHGVTSDGLPYFVEMAFGIFDDAAYVRHLATGVNWSPGLAKTSSVIDELLSEYRVEGQDQVMLLTHICCPKIGFSDRGKSRAELPPEIAESLRSVAKPLLAPWLKLKRQEDKDRQVSQRAIDAAFSGAGEISIKAACLNVIVEAIRRASSNFKYPANARQIMYKIRPLVLESTGGKWYKNSKTFTQDVLPEWALANLDEASQMDIVYDARGHAREPHTGRSVDLGTVAVRNYKAGWTDAVDNNLSVSFPLMSKTTGPARRYRYALFIEKEGFNALLEASGLLERHDIALMSTKGQSVVACRALIDSLSKQGVTILVCHDFDKSGVEIGNSLRTDSVRFQYTVQPNIIDIGLNLVDAQAMGLESELVLYDSEKDPRENLRLCGATEDECNFLVQKRTGKSKWEGQRIELNAMDSGQFIEFLESKFIECGVAKYVPEAGVIDERYRYAARAALAQREIEEILAKYQDFEIEIPEDLVGTVQMNLQNGSAHLPWDVVVGELASAEYTEKEAK